MVSIAGSTLSLVGVVIAVAQINRTLRAARAAVDAAAATQRLIGRNVLLSDIASCAAAVEEIKTLVRGNRHEAALLRVSDICNQLTRISGISEESKQSKALDLQEIRTQLSILRDHLELKLHQPKTVVSPVQVNAVLSEIALQLNHWIGTAQYLPALGDGDAKP